MINKIYILLFILVSFVIYPQEKNSKIKSLFFSDTKSINDTIRINKLYDISCNYPSTNIQKIDSLSEIILQLSKKNNYPKGFGYYYLNKGNTIKSNGNLKKAMSYFKISKYYFSKLKNKSLYLDCVYVIAFCYLDMNMSKSGEEIAIQALNESKKFKHDSYYKQLSRLNFFLGVYYSKVRHDDNKSINYHIKSNYYAKKINDFQTIYNCYSEIILIYFGQENWEKALYYSEICEKYVPLFKTKNKYWQEFYQSNNFYSHTNTI